MSKNGRYTKEEHTDSIILLADWLMDDVDDYNFWYDWLGDHDNAEATFVGCNSTWLYKNNNLVTIGSIGDVIMYEHKGKQTPENHKVKLSVDNAIELLISWEELLKIKPEHIIIYEENGVYRMEEVQ